MRNVNFYRLFNFSPCFNFANVLYLLQNLEEVSAEESETSIIEPLKAFIENKFGCGVLGAISSAVNIAADVTGEVVAAASDVTENVLGAVPDVIPNIVGRPQMPGL